MVSLVLILVAKGGVINLDSHTKCIMLYLVFLNNHLLLINIQTEGTLDMMIA